MSKTKDAAIDQANEQPKGTQVLTAKTRDDLFKQVEELKANLQEGQTLTAGAVGQSKDDGTFSIQIDII